MDASSTAFNMIPFLKEIYRDYLLSEKTPPNHIITIDLDEDKNAPYRDPIRLGEYVRSICTEKEKYYVFLDEIQKVYSIINPNLTDGKHLPATANDSDIISLSHMVLSERIDYKIFNNKKEVFFYNSDVSSTIPMLKKLLDGYLANGGDLQSGIQILAPMYAGNAGIDAINSFIQEEYNKEKDKILKRDFKIFKKNDKVLQLKNDSVHEIMNGDIGKILDVIKVDEKDAMLIDFDGRIITYMASDIENLTLAYCMSIHKSQGSEFENVIMPILPSYQIMLKKKIIYTGMTRAKKKLILLGKTQSLEQAIHAEDYLRQTYLTPRLSKKISNELDNKIFDKDIPFDTFGEYDMEGITPYSFMDK